MQILGLDAKMQLGEDACETHDLRDIFDNVNGENSFDRFWMLFSRFKDPLPRRRHIFRSWSQASICLREWWRERMLPLPRRRHIFINWKGDQYLPSGVDG